MSRRSSGRGPRRSISSCWTCSSRTLTALELIPLIKSLQPDARIITLTGQSSRELERRLRELGITYYMAKPFQREELQKHLSHLAGRPNAPTRCRGETPVDFTRLTT